jgi:predicted ATP-dependent protease
MLWCSKKYIKSFEDIKHHSNLKKKLQNCEYNKLINTLFYGIKGCGKKSIVNAYINHLITSYFNVKLEDIHETKKEIKCKTSNKIEVFHYSKTKYYYTIDMIKLGKKRLNFFDEFLKYIIQSENILKLPFNLIIIRNFDILDNKLLSRFKVYSEKYYNYTRFICITNYPKYKSKLISFATIRIPQLTKKETIRVIKDILNEEMPSVKTHTVGFEKKIDKIFDYSNNNLAKSIFYTQLLFQFGMVQFKNIALREQWRFERIYSLITSKYIKNIQDINKEKNTTLLTDPSNLKLKRLIYQCVMNTEKYEELIVGFLKFLINHKTEFFKKYNKEIQNLLKNVAIAHTNTNKTTFIITECFFMKLMTTYTLDNIKP